MHVAEPIVRWSPSGDVVAGVDHGHAGNVEACDSREESRVDGRTHTCRSSWRVIKDEDGSVRVRVCECECGAGTCEGVPHDDGVSLVAWGGHGVGDLLITTVVSGCRLPA